MLCKAFIAIRGLAAQIDPVLAINRICQQYSYPLPSCLLTGRDLHRHDQITLAETLK